jgi:hypothetical protein
MSDLSYEPIPVMSIEQIEAAVQKDDPDVLLYAVLSASLHSDDVQWAQSICFKLSAHPHFNVRGNAILGFGHLARLHGRLDEARVKPVIEAALRDPDDYVRGHAGYVADDVEHYLGWRIDRP